MKKQLVLLIALSAGVTGFAQKRAPIFHQAMEQFTITPGKESSSYTFSATTAAYAPLTGATNLATTYPWDDPEESVPVGFSFQSAFGASMTSLSFDISLGGSLSNDFTFPMTLPRIIFAPYEVDLIDRGYIRGVSESAIRYKTDGTAPNRIFKLEWENAGFYGEFDEFNQLNDFVNVQMWLYETSGIIEFRYGPSSIQSPLFSFEGSDGPLVGIADMDFANEAFNELMILTGAPANPVVVTDEINITELTGTPANGTLYRFTPVSLSTQSFEQLGVRTYPNPVHDMLHVAIDNVGKIANYKITDLTGKVLDQGKITGPKGSIAMSKYPNGIYIVTLEVDGQTAHQRIVK